MPKKNDVLTTALETYTVAGSIGSGGAGDVFEASDGDGLRVAIKVLRPNASTRAAKRFKNEVRFCQTNTHSNIIRITDTGVTPDGHSFCVMPLYDCSLRGILSEKLSDDDAMRIFGYILDGVEAAHLQRVFHRDLKPENILLTRNLASLVVADFGIAHFETDQLHTLIATLHSDRLANFRYAAPEQRESAVVADKRVDIYALGLTLHEILTGQVPLGEGPISIASTRPNLAYLDEISAQMRRQDREQRPAEISVIKEQILARRKEFAARQELDRLTNSVVKVGDITDVLVSDPPALKNVEFLGSSLRFTLSKSVNFDWVNEFQNPRGYGSIMGYPPSSVTFQGETATMRAEGRIAQQLINYFKDWLNSANVQYANKVRVARDESLRRAQSEREARIRSQEELVTVQSSLKW